MKSFLNWDLSHNLFISVEDCNSAIGRFILWDMEPSPIQWECGIDLFPF